jgi:hypothetical protein
LCRMWQLLFNFVFLCKLCWIIMCLDEHHIIGRTGCNLRSSIFGGLQ